MFFLIRKSWFRISLIFIVIVIIFWFLPYVDADEIRHDFSKVLQSSAILFAVCSALSLNILNNYIKGLKESSLKKVSDAKNIIEQVYDEFFDSKDDAVKSMVDDYIRPLLSFSTKDWLEMDEIKCIFDRVDGVLSELSKNNKFIIYRYLLRLEDEINEIGILYVRRLISDTYAEVILGVFLLLSVALFTMLLAVILPYTFVLNFIVIAASVAVIVFGVLEMLILTGFLVSEMNEESI